MTHVIKLLQKKVYEPGIIQNILSFHGSFTIDDINRSNELLDNKCKIRIFYDLFSDGSDFTRITIESSLAYLNNNICNFDRFRKYCKENKKKILFDTVITYWIAHYDFNTNHDNISISSFFYCQSYWITEKHIIDAFKMNHNVAKHVDTILYLFGYIIIRQNTQFKEKINMIYNTIIECDALLLQYLVNHQTIETAFKALMLNRFSYKHIDPALVSDVMKKFYKIKI